ncbi:hypothetical protein C8Q72DRAFT_45957 [Fomitopsis betulina]|nr:hypothetical protein C8Q72DRAFT_45957 [Fomitopsis betulina]
MMFWPSLASPESDVRAIIVSYGNTSLEASYLNIIKMYYALMKHLEQYPEQRHRFPGLETGRKVILTRGCSGPIAGEKYSVEDFHGRDGLGDIAERHPDLNAEAPTTEYPHLWLTDRPGVKVALDIIRNIHENRCIYIMCIRVD